MMTLSKNVKIAGQFLRSVRIDQDSGEGALDGYIFPQSLKELLLNMGTQHAETGQGAFTWTGPYGCGKSSLALAMTALLSGTEASREKTAKIVGKPFAKKLWKALPPRANGWICIPIIGRQENPQTVIARTLVQAKLAAPSDVSSTEPLIATLVKIAQSAPKTRGGLLLFIDEMGKFLENAALNGADAYFFQLLAEAASRSEGRFLIIGVLHQAFQEYANNLAREARDEWAKIQGRYTDISVNISGEEQIELISRAIVKKQIPSSAIDLGRRTGTILRVNRPAYSQTIDKILAKTWPLNPISALLLGPMSRRSYGQNQRSIFSFLSSSEGFGFQDFLRTAPAGEEALFLPAHFWDYLLFNHETSIAVSPDSHHFSATKDAIARCKDGKFVGLEVDILKTIALLELTRRQTGIDASLEAIEISLPHVSSSKLRKALKSLEDQSILVFKKFRSSYAVYEGSDFDIEDALEDAHRNVSAADISSISEALAVSAIGAKRHYHHTGTLRRCDFRVLPVNQLVSTAKSFRTQSDAFGMFALALPTEGEATAVTKRTIKDAQSEASDFDFVVASSKEAKYLVSLAKDRSAFNYILKTRVEMGRDKVARREVSDRLEALSHKIEQEVWRILNQAKWHLPGKSAKTLLWPELNGLISDLADQRFFEAPNLHNELLNRSKPSGSANGALKLLLHAMVMREGDQGLGFNKYPAEKGLFVSLIEQNNLYKEVDSKWRFVAPSKGNKSNLYPAWQAAREHLRKNKNSSVSLNEIYALWREAPFGIKDGLLPLLAVLFLLTERANLAFYRQGVFLATFSDIDVDYLLKAPSLIQFRWMNMSGSARQLLGSLAESAANLTGRPILNLEPLDVGRALIAAYDSAGHWVHKTARLSKNAIQIRNLFKRSSDPNKFIFDEIPSLYTDKADISTPEGITYVAQQVHDGLCEILGAYEDMLGKLKDQVLTELQVYSQSDQALQELNARAENIKGISGNIPLESFINRLSHFNNSLEQIESLVGLGINKPSKNWVDSDIDRAVVELVSFAQQFNKHEMFARVKGRKDKREAMAIVVGLDGRPVPVMHEFDIRESEKDQVSKLAREINKTLNGHKSAPLNVLLAALATVSAKVITKNEKKTPKQRKERA